MKHFLALLIALPFFYLLGKVDPVAPFDPYGDGSWEAPE